MAHALALGIGVGIGVVLMVVVLPRLARRLDVRLTPADQQLTLRKPVPRFEGFDPSLRERTSERRAIADRAKQRAAKIASGERVSELLQFKRKQKEA